MPGETLEELRHEERKKFQLNSLSHLIEKLNDLDSKVNDFVNHFDDRFARNTYGELLTSFSNKISHICRKTKLLLTEEGRAPIFIPHLDKCVEAVLQLTLSHEWGLLGGYIDTISRYNICKPYLGPLVYELWQFKILINAEYNRIKQAEQFTPFKLPDANTENTSGSAEVSLNDLGNDLLAYIFLIGLNACANQKDVKQFVGPFCLIRKQYLAIADKPNFKIYLQGFFPKKDNYERSINKLDQAIAAFFCDPKLSKNYSPLELNLLLSHPNADPNLYIIVDKEGKPCRKERDNEICCFRNEHFNNNYINHTTAYSYFGIDMKDYHRAKPLAFLAVANKDFKGLNSLIQANANIDIIDYYTEKASQTYGRYTVVFYPFRSKSGITLFQQALLTGDAETLSYFCRKEQDIIHKLLPSGETPLEYTVTTSNQNMVEALLSYGAKVKASMLHAAAKNGHVAVVNKLLDQGVDINSLTEGKETALNLAITHKQEGVVKCLLEGGADLTIKSFDILPLQRVIHSCNYTIFIHLLSKTLEGLSQEKANNAINDILRYAIKHGKNITPSHLDAYKKILEYLLDKTTLLKEEIFEPICEKENWIALKLLLKKSNEDDLNNLLHLSAAVSLTSWHGVYTHLAKFDRNKLLFQKNDLGQTSLHILFKTLASDKNRYNKFIRDYQEFGLQLLELHNDNLIQLSIDKDKYGKQPAHYLLDSTNCNINYFQKFISPTLKTQDQAGYTPLHYAAKNLNAQDFPCLVAQLNSATINTQSEDGKSLLHMAAIHGNTEAVKYLIVRPDIDLDLKDNQGKRAIDYAKNNPATFSEFKCVSINDFDQAVGNYIAYKDRFFGIRWLKSSEESLQAATQIKKASTQSERFKIAKQYVESNPNKQFAKDLCECVPTLKI